MTKRSKRFCIVTQNGYLGCGMSKPEAKRALAAEVKASAAACRRSSRRCSVIGSAQRGNVEIRIGGRQGVHLWQRYLISEDRS